jgi:uncharacterized membrane protein (UPF0136 family)
MLLRISPHEALPACAPGVLLVVFAVRIHKSKKVMPGGVLLVSSVIAFILLAWRADVVNRSAG